MTAADVQDVHDVEDGAFAPVGRYPVRVVCGFCASTLTIAMPDGATSTTTTGHQAWCPQVPKSRRHPAP